MQLGSFPDFIGAPILGEKMLRMVLHYRVNSHNGVIVSGRNYSLKVRLTGIKTYVAITRTKNNLLFDRKHGIRKVCSQCLITVFYKFYLSIDLVSKLEGLVIAVFWHRKK